MTYKPLPNPGADGNVMTSTGEAWASEAPSGGGAVDSVNGQTGVVVLDASHVGADPAGTTATHAALTVGAHGMTSFGADFVSQVGADDARDVLELVTIAITGSADDITSGTLNAARLPSSGVTPGAYTNADITVDAKGRITAANSGSATKNLGVLDFWAEDVYLSTNAAMGMFLGAAVSSGTNTTAIPAAAVDGLIPAGVFLRSSTTANGGYRYLTSSVVGDRFGGGTRKYQGVFRWLTAFTGRTVRCGFLDATTSADAQDGAYFEVVGNVVSAKTANNSTRTTNATTTTLSLDVVYTFDVEVNDLGTSARFRVYAGTNPTPILDVTNTTNIPTTAARAFGAGIVATESSTTASDIGILYRQGIGTVAGFAKLRGQP